jgi:hypothetical protein
MLRGKDASAKINSFNGAVWSGEAEKLAGKAPRALIGALDSVMNQTDTLIIWGKAPWLDAIDATWFEPEPYFESDSIRLFRHTRVN